MLLNWDGSFIEQVTITFHPLEELEISLSSGLLLHQGWIVVDGYYYASAWFSCRQLDQALQAMLIDKWRCSWNLPTIGTHIAQRQSKYFVFYHLPPYQTDQGTSFIPIQVLPDPGVELLTLIELWGLRRIGLRNCVLWNGQATTIAEINSLSLEPGNWHGAALNEQLFAKYFPGKKLLKSIKATLNEESLRTRLNTLYHLINRNCPDLGYFYNYLRQRLQHFIEIISHIVFS